MNYRKYFVITLFIPLTYTTVSASRWQFRKYQVAKEKFTRIRNQFSNFQIQKLELNNLPFDKESVNQWEFTLVGVTGRLSNNYIKVSRFKDGRYGHLLIGCIKTDDNQGLIVNFGWIPEDFEVKWPQNQTQYVQGILRKGEIKDYLNQKIDKQKLAGYQSYIDMTEFLEEFGLENQEKSQIFFIEKIEEYSKIQEQEMYPYVPTERNFEMPYLTPQKHMEYCTFWSCCSFIGFFTMQHVLRKW